jgi:hypothetical protein
VSTLADSVTALFEGRPEAIADPYTIFARLREEAPVFMHGGIALVLLASANRDPMQFEDH